MEDYGKYVAIAGDRFRIRPLSLLLALVVAVGLFVWVVNSEWSKYVSIVAYCVLVVVSFVYGYKNKYQSPLRRIWIELIVAVIGIALVFWSSSGSRKLTNLSFIVTLMYTIAVVSLWLWFFVQPPLGFVSVELLKEYPEDKMNGRQLVKLAIKKGKGFRI